MSQSFVQTASAIETTTATSISKAYASNNTAGNLLFCTVFILVTTGTSNGTLSVSDSHGAWTALPYTSLATFQCGWQSFYKLKCAGGANSVTATETGFNTPIKLMDLIIGEWSGADTLDAHVEGAPLGTTHPVSGNLTTHFTDICIGHVGMFSLTSATWVNTDDTSYTVRSANTNKISFSSKENISPGTFGFADHQNDVGTSTTSASLATFYLAAGGGSNSLMMMGCGV